MTKTELDRLWAELQRTILDVVAKGDLPFTAEGVISQVQKTWPRATYQSILAQLAWLVEQGKEK